MGFISGGIGLLLSIVGLVAGFLAMKQKPGAKLVALGFAANLIVQILSVLGGIFLYKIPVVGTIVLPILMGLLSLVFYLGMVLGIVLLCGTRASASSARPWATCSRAPRRWPPIPTPPPPI